MSEKRNIFLWGFYDFANSIVVIAFFLYFSQWLVANKGVSDLWFNLIFTGSSLLLLLTAPVVGSIADKRQKRMPYLRFITLLSFLFFIAAGIFANFISFTTMGVILAALSFMVANYLYQFSLCIYNSFVKDLVSPEKRGRLSGIGQSANWFGQVTGILITLPLATGALYLFGEPGRAQVFLPAAVISIVLSLPMLLWFKEKEGVASTASRINIKEEYKAAIQNFKDLIKVKGVGVFLLSYFLFNDAILTATNNFPIYLENVLGLPDKTKSLLSLIILLTAGIGAFLSGFVADKLGLKRTMKYILIGWLFFFPAIALQQNINIFYVLIVLMGFWYGASLAVPRAIMAHLTPWEKLNHGFSYYTLAERFSTFIGPIGWGLATTLFFHTGSTRYRIAMFVMTAFILVGLLVFNKVPSDREIKNG